MPYQFIITERHLLAIAQHEPQYQQGLQRVLYYLINAKILTDEIFIRVLAHAQVEFSWGLCNALEHSAKYLQNRDEAIYRELIQHPNEATSLVIIYIALERAAPTLLNHTNRAALIQNVQYANGLSAAICTLKNANPSLLNQDNFTLLIQNAQYAEPLSHILETLNSQNLLKQTNYTTLMQSAHHAATLKTGLMLLSSSEDLFALLIRFRVERFDHASKKLLTQAHYDSVMRAPHDAENIARGIVAQCEKTCADIKEEITRIPKLR